MLDDKIDSLVRDLGDLIARNSRWIDADYFEVAAMRAMAAYLPPLDEPMSVDDAVEAFTLALNGPRQ